MLGVRGSKEEPAKKIELNRDFTIQQTLQSPADRRRSRIGEWVIKGAIRVHIYTSPRRRGFVRSSSRFAFSSISQLRSRRSTLARKEQNRRRLHTPQTRSAGR